VATNENDVAIAQAAQRWLFARQALWVFYIAALAIPLLPAIRIADSLSGKNTSVHVAVSINIVISLAVSAGAVALYLKTRSQGKELQRLRDRIHQLEGGS
jgi:hypothetical protein